MTDSQASNDSSQQISTLNARIINVNLANADLIREFDTALRTMAKRIAALEKENQELKAKIK